MPVKIKLTVQVLFFLSLIFSLTEAFGKQRKKSIDACSVQLEQSIEAAEKDFRRRIAAAKPSEHGYKHVKAKDNKTAVKYSYSEAQYLPEIDHHKIEKIALREGQPVMHSSTTYFFYKSDKIVGYDKGQPTYWIRTELTSGNVFHGHPISLERVRKYVKGAK